MAEDERLREALLELQLLRDRETRVLEDTQTLLECLEIYSAAQNADAALASIFVSLANKIGAARSLFVRKIDDNACEIMASDTLNLVGTQFAPPINLFTRSRNVTDLMVLGDWTGPLDFTAYGGLIVAPAQDNTALLVFKDKPGVFGKDSMTLTQRLAGLTMQAVRNSAIAAENTLLASTIAGSSAGFAIADATGPDRPLVYVNAAFERLSGYSAAEVLGQNCRFLSAEPKNAAERVRLRAAVKNASQGTFLLRNRRKSGAEFWNELTLFPVRDSTGTVRNLVATQSDVTERVEATQERDQMRARMERALAATEGAFLVLESDDTVAFANAAVGDLFPSAPLNWATGTTFKQNWRSYLKHAKTFPHRATRLVTTPDIDGLLTNPRGFEVDLPDGRSILLRGARLDDGGMVLSATDVSEMKSAQRLLSQRLAAIEAATDGIAIADEAGRLTYLNSAAALLMGFQTTDAGFGQVWSDRYDGATPAHSIRAFSDTFTRRDITPNQTHEISASILENGGCVIVLRDITAQLETEARQEALTQDIIRLQRQEAIAQLTAGIAHDFNNLLSAINGSTALIDMMADVPPAITPHVNRISAAGTQAAKLVNRLLDVGAGSEGKGVFELNSTLADLPALVQPSLPQRIAFHVSPVHDALVLRGNPGALTQVLINLALNARDAIGPKTGQIDLRVTRILGDRADPVQVGTLNAQGAYACFELRDTGMGMTAETRASVFKPYFTTKGRQGTGLGLATVAMQVQSAGGAIGLTSAPGRGTTFFIYWPVAPIGNDRKESVKVGSHDLTNMTVIVVDDDPQVGEVIAGYLEANGAEVAVCQDPRDAADAIADAPDGWGALITDYDMPGMNGGELTAQVRKVAPDLPIFVVTALARRLTDPRLANGQVTDILPKPVDLDHLCAMLAKHNATFMKH